MKSTFKENLAVHYFLHEKAKYEPHVDKNKIY